MIGQVLDDRIRHMSDGFADAPSSVDALFHDEEIDGPLPERLRVLALTLAAERTVAAARVAGLADVDLVAAEDVPDMLDAANDAAGPEGGSHARTGAGPAEQQLAVLAVRLEMAAVYMRLVRG